MKSILIYLLFFTSFAMCSGAFDNGTATGKGKFKLDLTINPFNKISFGQTYGVISYGITDRIDIHGYISDHSGNFTTIYGGIFYQFFKSDKIDLATAFGVRSDIEDKEFKHLFFPQLLYTINLSEKIFIGGSMVNVMDKNTSNIAIDIGIFYKLKYLKNVVTMCILNNLKSSMKLSKIF